MVGQKPILGDAEWLVSKLMATTKSMNKKMDISRGTYNVAVAAHIKAKEGDGMFKEWDKVMKRARKGKLHELAELMCNFCDKIPKHTVSQPPLPLTPSKICQSNRKQHEKSGKKEDLKKLAGFMMTQKGAIIGSDGSGTDNDGNQAPASPTNKVPTKADSCHFILRVGDVIPLITLMQTGKDLSIGQIVESGL